MWLRKKSRRRFWCPDCRRNVSASPSVRLFYQDVFMHVPLVVLTCGLWLLPMMVLVPYRYPCPICGCTSTRPI